VDSLTLPVLLRLLAMLKELPPADMVLFSVVKNLNKQEPDPIETAGVPVRKGKVIGGTNG
jgi:hypothetical protein